MSHNSAPFAPLPPDTAHVARSVFNLQSRYLALGDQLDELFGDVDWDDLDRFGPTPTHLLFVLAMVTIFQFSEDLTDRQAASAARTRMDWKYAIHLPVDHPGFSPRALAEFRRRLDSNSAGRRIFGQMVNRVAWLGLLAAETDVSTILATVDSLNCVEEVSEAMHLTLEALACSDPDRLRSVVQPYWYRRYGPAAPFVRVPHTQEERQTLLAALESDISSLLATIAEDEPTLLQWPEVQALDRLWQRRFGPSTPIATPGYNADQDTMIS